MVVDGVSWRILLQDMATAFEQLQQQAGQQQKSIELQPKTSSFQQWGEFLENYANSEALDLEKAYWLAQQEPSVKVLPVDHEEQKSTADNRISTSKTISFELAQTQTHALLNECTSAYRTQINDLLLSALYLALRQWTEQSTFRIDLESHGREPLSDTLDLTQTMGWFTSVFPVNLSLASEASIRDVIKTVKEQLRTVPNNGIGFGLLQYMAQDAGLTDNASEILFNYLGQFDQVVNSDSAFQLANEDVGEDVSTERQRSHALEFNGLVTGGQLGFSLRFNGLHYDQETMESCLMALNQP